jgi:hypothetical protein
MDVAADQGKAVAVIHDPLTAPPNPGHTLIIGADKDDKELLQAWSILVQLRPFTPEAISKSQANP